MRKGENVSSRFAGASKATGFRQFVPGGAVAMGPAACLVDARFRVGESPLWDGRHGRLLWADVPAGTVHELELGTGRRRHWTFGGPVGSFGLARSGRLVLAVGSSVHLFDPRSEHLTALARIDTEPDTNRLNDGKVGPDGAFWVGSMDERPEKAPVAALYRVTASGDVERKVTECHVSNGLAWTADGRTMFHADTFAGWIDRWRFDPDTGAISERRRVRTLTDEEGRPDGAAVDLEGCYWSAGVTAACLNRFTADGELLARIRMPVPQPTMPCFGGADMKTLFVTSLSDRQGADVLARYPKSGAVFAIRVDVPGVPVGLFAD